MPLILQCFKEDLAGPGLWGEKFGSWFSFHFYGDKILVLLWVALVVASAGKGRFC